MISHLISSLLIIFLALFAGYVVQRLKRGNKLPFELDLEKSRKRIQKIAILYILPVTFVGVYWTMDFSQIKLFLLPILGFFQLILGGLIAILIAKNLRMNHLDTGAFFCCGFFSNLLNIGGLVCFLMLGEEGYKLVTLYIFFVHFAYYAIGFPIAKYFSLKNSENNIKIFNIKTLLKDPFIIIVMSSIFTGLSFNLSGLERPSVFSSIIAIFVPVSTILLLFSIGLSMKPSKLRDYLKVSVLIAGIKFLIIPIVMLSLSLLIGYHKILDALPLKVIMILSSTPVAFNSLIPPSLYGLNLDLANSCWIFTTFGLIFTLPILFLLVNMI